MKRQYININKRQTLKTFEKYQERGLEMRGTVKFVWSYLDILNNYVIHVIHNAYCIMFVSDVIVHLCGFRWAQYFYEASYWPGKTNFTVYVLFYNCFYLFEILSVPIYWFVRAKTLNLQKFLFACKCTATKAVSSMSLNTLKSESIDCQ